MLKYSVLSLTILILSIFALVVPGKSSPAVGSWQIDPGHSDAQFVSDGTTDFGKTKIMFTVGFARVAGVVKINGNDSADSSFDFSTYSALSKAPPMDENGKVNPQWIVTPANHTLVCFHSKGVRQTPDGKLQTTGTLVLTRVDRNVDETPSEAYAGPVYGPPMIHRMTHEATFVFEVPTPGRSGSAFHTNGSTKVIGEDFPQLVKAVIGTYWPPVVQDENCQVPDPSEGYNGAQCTGTYLQSAALPEPPHAANAEDIGTNAQNFNTVTGQRLTILVHMRLTPTGGGQTTPGK
jgi:polyisoprenoid-binding protein YceI